MCTQVQSSYRAGHKLGVSGVYRDIDITQLQAFDEKNSPSNRDLTDSEDCFRARKSTLCGGLAGLQDPDNMTI